MLNPDTRSDECLWVWFNWRFQLSMFFIRLNERYFISFVFYWEILSISKKFGFSQVNKESQHLFFAGQCDLPDVSQVCKLFFPLRIWRVRDCSTIICRIIVESWFLCRYFLTIKKIFYPDFSHLVGKEFLYELTLLNNKFWGMKLHRVYCILPFNFLEGFFVQMRQIN